MHITNDQFEISQFNTYFVQWPPFEQRITIPRRKTRKSSWQKADWQLKSIHFSFCFVLLCFFLFVPLFFLSVLQTISFFIPFMCYSFCSISFVLFLWLNIFFSLVSLIPITVICDSDDVIDPGPENVELVPCQICERTFAPSALEKHVGICEKMHIQRRTPFDSFRQRREGTTLETYLPSNYGLIVKPKTSKLASPTDAKSVSRSVCKRLFLHFCRQTTFHRFIFVFFSPVFESRFRVCMMHQTNRQYHVGSHQLEPNHQNWPHKKHRCNDDRCVNRAWVQSTRCVRTVADHLVREHLIDTWNGVRKRVKSQRQHCPLSNIWPKNVCKPVRNTKHHRWGSFPCDSVIFSKWNLFYFCWYSFLLSSRSKREKNREKYSSLSESMNNLSDSGGISIMDFNSVADPYERGRKSSIMSLSMTSSVASDW